MGSTKFQVNLNSDGTFKDFKTEATSNNICNLRIGCFRFEVFECSIRIEIDLKFSRGLFGRSKCQGIGILISGIYRTHVFTLLDIGNLNIKCLFAIGYLYSRSHTIDSPNKMWGIVHSTCANSDLALIYIFLAISKNFLSSLDYGKERQCYEKTA